MTITPFLTLNLRRKKDLLLARQRARRVASLLGYDIEEQACIAAGVFVVACQGLERFGQGRLCFQIADRQLRVFAEESGAQAGGNRISKLLVESTGTIRLVKRLPAEQNIEERDLSWLVHKVEATACDGVFAEVVKQNQELLAILHELRLFREDITQQDGKNQNPRAA